MSKVLTDQIEKRTGGTAIDLPATGKWPAASIADDAITADKILADSITTAKILDDNITTAKILDNNVTLAKLSDGTQGGTIYYGASGAPTELAAGTSGQFLQTTGASADPAWATVASSGFVSVQTFTASGIYTVPTGVTKQLVFVTGSGGGGANTNASNGASSGGAGGTVIKFLELAATSTVTVAIGAAGAANGGVGNVTTFTTASGTSFTALTGPAGQPGRLNNNNVAPTMPSGGDLNLAGGAGAGTMSGGASFWGGGGQTAWGAVTIAGPGVAYGSGGGTGSSNTSYHDGKAGAAGVVFVLEYK